LEFRRGRIFKFQPEQECLSSKLAGGADDDRTCNRAYFRGGNGLEHDLRADARWVSRGDSYARLVVSFRCSRHED